MTQEVVGVLGLGRLGRPLATAFALRGLETWGWDADPAKLAPTRWHREGDWAGKPFAELLNDVKVNLAFSLAELVGKSSVLFVCVQTPHGPEYGGELPAPRARRDFDYSALKAAVAAVADEAVGLPEGKLLVVVSTGLPGTCRRELFPLLNNPAAGLKFAYSPQFLAMGTALRDLLTPEFFLVGTDDDPQTVARLRALYLQLSAAPLAAMSIESAELAKVAYNTAISQRIAFANAVMEVSHKTPGANCDDVSAALRLSTRRVASAAYLQGGLGDAGACHPRDNIAASWLAEQLKLSWDPFGSVIAAREAQSDWLASVVHRECDRAKTRRVVLMGYAYKPEIDLVDGSAALLLREQLMARGLMVDLYDPLVDPESELLGYVPERPPVFVLTVPHAALLGFKYPAWATVVDPHRVLPPEAATRVVHVGKGETL